MQVLISGTGKRIDVRNIPAGREIDSMVAAQIMDWENVSLSGRNYFGKPPKDHYQKTQYYMVPRYSKNISSAWRVVEKLRQMGWLVVIKEMPDGIPFMYDEVAIWEKCLVQLTWTNLNDAENTSKKIHRRPFATADTTPLAICRAALLAVQYDN